MRVKRGVTSHAKHHKLRNQTKGMSTVRRSSVKQARQAVLKALSYAYRDRRNRKRDFRRTWIRRINAGAREFSLSYSQLMNLLKKAEIKLDRKILSELAARQPEAFKAVVNTAQKATK